MAQLFVLVSPQKEQVYPLLSDFTLLHCFPEAGTATSPVVTDHLGLGAFSHRAVNEVLDYDFCFERGAVSCSSLYSLSLPSPVISHLVTAPLNTSWLHKYHLK